jgi:hypothetical protein
MLIIDHHDGWHLFGRSEKVALRITLPVLNAFAANGAAGVRITGAKDNPLALVMQGAGSIEASGAVPSLNARMNGAGDMNLSNLTATDATVVVNGAGSMEVTVTGSLEATPNGVGSITYGGKPQHLDTRINGVGSLSPVSHSGG